MKKKILAALLASAMILSLAACDDGKKPSDSSDSKSSDSKGSDDSKSSDTKGGDDSSDSNGEKTVINFYTFTDETQGMIDYMKEKKPEFFDKYDVKIDLTGKASDYITKVESALSSGGVDIYVADFDYSIKFANYDKTASVADLGITVNEADYYSYVIDVMKVGGTLKGLTHQATPGMMFYRQDIAEELGYDTPEKMQEAVKDWDGFLKVADELKAKTSDATAMVCGADELKRNFLNSRASAWVVDNKLSYDTATIDKFMEVTGHLVDNDEVVSTKNEQWQTAWYDGMGNDTVFSYFGPTWYLHYTIKPHCAADWDEKAPEADQTTKGTYGKWRMIEGPASYFWGGTYWFGSKSATEDAAKKEGVAEIIKFFCVDDESMEAYALKTGDFTSKKTIVDKIKSNEQFVNPFLGGQNHYEIFAKAAESLGSVTNMTQYDDSFNTAFDNMITNAFVEKMSKDDYVAAFKDAVKAALPDLEIE